MRFRPAVQPRFGARRDQRRVVMLFGMLVLVILSMTRSSNPKNWEWLTGKPQQEKKITAEDELLVFKQQEALKEQLLSGAQPLDFKSRSDTNAPAPDPGPTQPDAAQPDSVRAVDATRDVKAEVKDGATGTVPSDPREKPASKTTDAVLPNPKDAAKLLAQPPLFAIPKSVFESINEQGLHIRPAEAPAYWAVLATARDVSQTELEQAALTDLTYAQIFSDPDFYRGQPMTLEGELLKFTKLPQVKNEFGIDTVYEGWMLNPDSGKNPYVFHCLDKPPELLEGEKLREKIRITGFFFKRYLYAAKSGLPHAAPLLLAKRFRWFPVIQRPVADPSWAPYIIGTLVIVGTLLGMIIVWSILRDQRRSNAQLKRFVAPSITDFGPLDPPAPPAD